MKKAAIVVLALVALVAIGVFWAYNSLDVIVKVALEHYAPRIAGVDVKVGAVSISPRDGRGSLKGIEIGNAPGFTAPHAARLGTIAVALDPATVRGPVVLVHEIAIDSASITYERGKGGTNLDAIQKNIAAYVARSAEASPGGDGAAPSPIRHKFVIERIALRGITVTMTTAGLKGQGVSFEIPDIELRDVGKRQDGVTASEAANVVAGAVISAIARKVLTNIDLLRKGGVEGAVDALKGLLQ
ncbi:MAG: hypothetical protein ACXWHB_10520 [Usitatibacter sp.]